jgi:hypothetical protein
MDITKGHIMSTYEMRWPIIDPAARFNQIIVEAETDLGNKLKVARLQATNTTVYRLECDQLRWVLCGQVEVTQ